MYFADPYCAWQKGTNENLNGLLREFYPKGRNLERVSPITLKKNLALINARPKKVLNYQKPVDLFNYFDKVAGVLADNLEKLLGGAKVGKWLSVRSDVSRDAFGGVVPGVCAVLFDCACRDSGILARRRDNRVLRSQYSFLVWLCGVCKPRVGAELFAISMSRNETQEVVPCLCGRRRNNLHRRASVLWSAKVLCLRGD